MNTIPNKKPGFFNFVIRELYTCFGLGLLPKAPGTFGTLLGIPLYFLLILFFDLKIFILVTIIVFFLGWWLCMKAEKELGTHDDHRVVIDEVLGYLVTMVPFPALPVLPLAWLWGFFLFRFFDILKPGPVGYADRNIQGGFGVMFDDLLAGLFAWIVLFLANYGYNHFFVLP
ncbi:MAG: phosphatidylglycerophosphatase A [Deltaproteobacteria bacterium]|jgi:phosphatidylglycerophosphatase A|nr:phosphatidylglycerophosphatase A [Deltaproteobacteria bacterium]